MSCAADRGDFPAWPRKGHGGLEKITPQGDVEAILGQIFELDALAGRDARNAQQATHILRVRYASRPSRRRLSVEQVARLRAAPLGMLHALVREFAKDGAVISVAGAWKIQRRLTYRDLP